MPPSPLEMTHVGQMQNFRVGSSNHILNSMDRGGSRGGGGGQASQVSAPRAPNDHPKSSRMQWKDFEKSQILDNFWKIFSRRMPTCKHTSPHWQGPIGG